MSPLVNIGDFKAVKQMFDNATKEFEKGQVHADCNEDVSKIAFNRGGIFEKKAEKNVNLIAKLLKLDYNTIIDMVWDNDFAKQVLSDIQNKVAA